MKFRRLFLPFIVFCAVITPTLAWPEETWTYTKLNEAADFIVVATPMTVRDSSEKTVLPGIARQTADKKNAPVDAIGVETIFQIDIVLKGQWSLSTFILFHLRELSPPAQSAPGAPQLVSFTPAKGLHYLLFLKQEKDGRFTCVSGQTDPALSIRQLDSALPPALPPAPAPTLTPVPAAVTNIPPGAILIPPPPTQQSNPPASAPTPLRK